MKKKTEIIKTKKSIPNLPQTGAEPDQAYRVYRNQEHMASIRLAPWIGFCSGMRLISRKVGGNAFRHGISVLGILVDYTIDFYRYDSDGGVQFGFAPAAYKAAIAHDLLEEFPDIDTAKFAQIDEDGPQVVSLVLELTRSPAETKREYLKRLADASDLAKIIKGCDRIHNLTEIIPHVHKNHGLLKIVRETNDFILPMLSTVADPWLARIAGFLSRELRFMAQSRFDMVSPITRYQCQIGSKLKKWQCRKRNAGVAPLIAFGALRAAYPQFT